MGISQSSHKISAQDRAILDLKIQRDKLHQYQKHITVITSRETAIAKSCLARNDRQRALLALRRKKFQETLLAKTDAQLATLEQLTSNVEFALVQKDVMFGLKQGTDVLKQIHAEMGGIDSVEKLMGENADARAYQEDISLMLEGGLSRAEEEDVEQELETLEEGVLGVQQQIRPDGLGVAKVELPSVPSTQPVYAEESKDKARRKAMVREERSADTLELLPA